MARIRLLPASAMYANPVIPDATLSMPLNVAAVPTPLALPDCCVPFPPARVETVPSTQSTGVCVDDGEGSIDADIEPVTDGDTVAKPDTDCNEESEPEKDDEIEDELDPLADIDANTLSEAATDVVNEGATVHDALVLDVGDGDTDGDIVDGVQLAEAMTVASCTDDRAMSHTRRSVKAPGQAIQRVKDWPPCCGEFPHMAEPPTL